MTRECLRLSAALMLLAAASCSSSSSSGDNGAPPFTGATRPTTTGSQAVAGAGAAPTMTGGSAQAGTGAPPITSTKPATPGAGASGAPAMTGSTAPSSGSMMPSTRAAAGSGGSNAAHTAGSGGTTSAAAAGSGAAAMTGMTGAAFIREAMPTEDSIKKNGEFTVKSYTERDGLVGGDAYGDAAIAGDGSELYYPEGATPPFAAMVIVPGFTAQRSDVAPWGEFLASHGIVSLVIDTNSTSDQPDVRSLALLDAVESLKKENMREGSAIKGKLDTTRVGLMGWSMGGGGTWISADAHPELKVAVSLCGWIVQGVGSQTSVPSLQLAVVDDELAAGMSQPVYNAMPDSTPKMLVEWNGGGHWINNSPQNKDNEVGGYGLPWIKVFLEKDERYRQFFKRMPPGTSDYMTNQ